MLKFFFSFGVILVVVLCSCMEAAAQVSEYKVVSDNDEFNSQLSKEIRQVKDSIIFINKVQESIRSCWEQGYATAHLDTVVLVQDTLVVEVYIGQLFLFEDVEIDDRDIPIIQASGLKNFSWQDKKISKSLIFNYAESMLEYLENNGYPFAQIRLDSTAIDKNGIRAKLNLKKNDYVPFDNLHIIGNVDLIRDFFDQYLGIKVDEPYSRKKVSSIQKKINDLTFIELDSIPIIKFENGRANVHLFVKKKRASRFDFIIGVQPTNQGGERKFSITGDFMTEMTNRLGRGEYLFANIQSRQSTKVLDVRFKYPYLFRQPLGVDTKGKIFFNEEFRETIGDVGMWYQLRSNSTLKASWQNKSSRLIELDTAAIVQSKKLPNKLDVVYNGGGLELSTRSLDYLFNPSKGWTFNVSSTVGIKRIIRNNTIEGLSRSGLDFNAAYDSLKLKTFQVECTASGALYIPLFSSGTLKLSTVGGLQYNEQKLFDNELYRLGGSKLLRGFDEQSILSDVYWINSLEFRLILDRNSYLSFPFIDYGVTRVRVGEEELSDQALSFGMGLNFATPAGIFNVSFAVGKRLDNPFDFGNTKIHFGYVSLF